MKRKITTVIILLIMICCTFTRSVFAVEIGTTAKIQSRMDNSERLSLTTTPRATTIVPEGYLAKEIWKQVLGETSKGVEAIDSTYKDRLAAFTGKLDLSVLAQEEYLEDLTGLEYLTNVTELNLKNTNPKSVNFKGNIALKKLVLEHNEQLLNPDLSANINLEELNVTDCALGVLDLRANTKLKILDLKEMVNKLKNEHATIQFSELLLGEKPELTTFNLSGGALSKLDLSGATALTSCNIEPQFVTCGMLVDGDYNLDFDMKSLVGKDGLSKINKMFIETATGDSYDNETGKLYIDVDSNMNYHPDDSKGSMFCYIRYTYQTGASLSGNPILLETYAQYDNGSPEYTVKFKDWDGKTLKTVNKLNAGDTVSAPSDPVRVGYDFKGWDQNIDYVVKTMDVYPIYEVKATTKVNAIFKDYDGTQLKVIEVLSGKGVASSDVPSPIHEGLTFLKWDKSYNRIEADTTITAIYEMPVFKDQEFRKVIWEKVLNKRLNSYDVKDTTYKIYTSDLATISTYNEVNKANLFSGITTITSLNGIEYFKSLDYLSCSDNPGLMSVDLSYNKALKHVGLKNCALETLILGNLPNLRMLWCDNNDLKELDISGCPNLGFEQFAGEGFGDLSVDNNKFEFKGLKIGIHPYLRYINMRNNPNQGIIEVQGCPELLDLNAMNTGIVAINVTKNSKLRNLDVSYNKLANLDVTRNTKLQGLWLTGGSEGHSSATGNNVSILNLDQNSELNIIDCSSNGIATLDITHNPKLTQLRCSGNELTTLNLANAKELKILKCSSNKLSNLDVSENTKLEELNCSVNTSINKLNLKKNLNLTKLECAYNSLEELDLSQQSKLIVLSCTDNQLYRLDLHSDAFKGVGSVAYIKDQRARTVNAGMDSVLSKFAYDITKLVGLDTIKSKISLNDLTYGSYDSTMGKIIFDSYDIKTPFTYQYSTNNSVVPQLQVKLTPEFGNFFQVNYYDGIGVLKRVEALENSKLVAPLGIPAARTGWEFVGWYKESGLVTEWNFKEDMIISDTNLYAKWLQKKYKVSYETGTTPMPSIDDAKYEDKLAKPINPILPGQAFDGWYKDDTYQNIWDFDNDVVTSETTLYAKWKSKVYKVKYDTLSKESTIDEKTNVLYKDNGLLPSKLPKRNGYDFDGWSYKGVKLTNDIKYEELVETDEISSVTLSAIWKPHLFTVHYITGYPEIIVSDKKNVTWDDANLLPSAPRKPGYQLKSWKSNGREVSSTHKYNELTTDSTTGTDVTLIAEWVERNDYRIVFNPNNGVLPEGTDTKVDNLKYTSSIQLPVPTRKGYIFKGWTYLDVVVNDSALYNDLDKTDTVSMVELKALWKAINYTVTFDYVSKVNPEGISIPKVNVDYGQQISQPVLILLENWIFDGWYLNKECTQKYDFNMEIISDITLYGHWTHVESKKTELPNTSDKDYMLNFLLLALSAQIITYVYLYKKNQKN